MLNKFTLFTIFIAGIIFSFNPVQAATISDHTLCQSSFSLTSKPRLKSQQVKLSETVSMTLENSVSIFSKKGTRIATNINCQVLMGHQYSGSAEEWAKFIDSAIQGLTKANYKKVKFTLVGNDEKMYSTDKQNKEYIFSANFEGINHLIYNLAVLDKKQNTVYTFSVSGAAVVKAEVENEYNRLVQSLTINK